MKKVMFLSAAALVLGLAFTNGSVTGKVQTAVTVQEKDVTYQEISVDKLPKPVVEALTNEYKDFAIDKAWLGSDHNYKVKISKGTSKYSVFLSEQGKILKAEQPKNEM